MRSLAFKIEGDLTALEAGVVKKRLEEAHFQPGDRLTIDLFNVNYIDSSGLGVLVAAFKRLKEYGGSVRLRGLQPRVRAVLDVTRMSQVFEIIDGGPDDFPPAGAMAIG